MYAPVACVDGAPPRAHNLPPRMRIALSRVHISPRRMAFRRAAPTFPRRDGRPTVRRSRGAQRRSHAAKRRMAQEDRRIHPAECRMDGEGRSIHAARRRMDAAERRNHVLLRRSQVLEHFIPEYPHPAAKSGQKGHFGGNCGRRIGRMRPPRRHGGTEKRRRKNESSWFSIVSESRVPARPRIMAALPDSARGRRRVRERVRRKSTGEC